MGESEEGCAIKSLRHVSLPPNLFSFHVHFLEFHYASHEVCSVLNVKMCLLRPDR